MFLGGPEFREPRLFSPCGCLCETRQAPVRSLMVDFNHNVTTAVLLTVVRVGNGLERTTGPTGGMKVVMERYSNRDF